MTKVTAVSTIDLNRYLGRWYEVARLPLKWEDPKATDITATYSLNESGTIRVDNRCFNEDGKASQAVGEASVQNDGNSELKVNFLPEFIRWLPFTSGDYWILKIDNDYQHALVGTPDHKNLWLLSRTPHISDDVKAEYLLEARQQGFDLEQLIVPRHNGREVTDAMIEEANNG